MIGQVTYGGGNQLIQQPNFVRSIDVTSADFDGTATASIADSLKTQETNGSKFNPWKKNGGFIVQPSADATLDVLTWEDYERNGKSVDDTLKQSVIATGGVWCPVRVVKVYTTSTVKTYNIGTVI